MSGAGDVWFGGGGHSYLPNDPRPIFLPIWKIKGVEKVKTTNGTLLFAQR